MPGTTPRVWYYFLKQVDPTHDRFRLIVLPLDTYADYDRQMNFTNLTTDLSYIAPFNLPRVFLDLVTTYTQSASWREIVMDSLFKAYTLRTDLRDFLLNPLLRIRQVHEHDVCFYESEMSYKGNPNSFEELLQRQVSGRQLPADKVILDRMHTPLSEPQEGESSQRKYKQFWLNRILGLYGKSPTKFLIVRIPKGPFGVLSEHTGIGKALNSVASLHNVYIAPAELFDDLENPKYFSDELHLNSTGRRIFTARLTQEVILCLGIHSASYGAPRIETVTGANISSSSDRLQR